MLTTLLKSAEYLVLRRTGDDPTAQYRLLVERGPKYGSANVTVRRASPNGRSETVTSFPKLYLSRTFDGFSAEEWEEFDALPAALGLTSEEECRALHELLVPFAY